MRFNMKRNGYTIAEAIITMAIIGVVASLTIPTFISSYRKTVYANSLASAVSNFDNAMTTMMMKEGVDDLLDTKAWKAVSNSLSRNTSDDKIEEFMAEITKVLPIEGYEKDLRRYSALANPGAAPNITFGAPVTFRTKAGVEYMIYATGISKANAKAEAATLLSGSNYHNKAAEVYIDVNGANEPNVQGRDWFRFDLGTDGNLYPFGGRDQSLYAGGAYNPETNCVTNKNGYHCAAYLMENGYKMDY